MTIYNCDYCVCKEQMPEEIKRGVIVCQNCEKEINPADLGREEDEGDFSTCNDTVDNYAMEQQMASHDKWSY